MRVLNGWPLILLVLFFGIGLLPTVAMISLSLFGVSWWGSRTAVAIGMFSFFVLELTLLMLVTGLAGQTGYQLKIGGTRGLREGLIAVVTFLSLVHFLPALFFVSALDVLFPWGGSPTSRIGLETAAFLFLALCLMFIFIVAADFGSGYFKARRDARKSLPPKA
jgi:hypothetical protein